MAYTYVTGPIHHFIVLPYNPNQALYLGTAKIAPKIRIRRGYKPVFNDLGGQLLPFERIAQGEEAQIITPLNRYNEAVYSLISAAPRFGNPNTGLVRGSNSGLDVGAKVYQNGCFFTLILQFPFANTINSPPVAGMPVCYRFPVCISEQDDFDSLGTDARDVMLAITAQRAYIPSVQGLGSFVTYDNSTGGVSLPSPD